ncbi:hypothetical protein [Candidatus Vidania fulgoroideorum]
MYNILEKKIFFKKIFFKNLNLNYSIKKNIYSFVLFFLKKNNFLINFIFLKYKNFNKIKEKFNIFKCDNTSIVFNYNYNNILFKNFHSDVFINKNKIISNDKIDIKILNNLLFHSLYHVFGKDHLNQYEYKKMLFYKFKFDSIYNELM